MDHIGFPPRFFSTNGVHNAATNDTLTNSVQCPFNTSEQHLYFNAEALNGSSASETAKRLLGRRSIAQGIPQHEFKRSSSKRWPFQKNAVKQTKTAAAISSTITRQQEQAAVQCIGKRRKPFESVRVDDEQSVSRGKITNPFDNAGRKQGISGVPTGQSCFNIHNPEKVLRCHRNFVGAGGP